MSLASTSETFSELPPYLAAPLRRRGFQALTSVQRAVLAAHAEGRDLRISSQTGSGKTVALGIALCTDLAALRASHAAEADGSSRAPLAAGPLALVIVPTRELAAQVREELAWLYADLRWLRTELATGGTSVVREQKLLSAGPALVVGTPGRLLDHVRTGALDCAGVRHVVLDEADRMLDMGFREELEAILDALPKPRRTHLVSATLPAALLRLADRFQERPLHVEGTPLGVANQSIEHVAHAVQPYETYSALVNLLLLEPGQRCLVFVQRRIDASSLAQKLSDDGFSALPFSGELPQAERNRTLSAFRQGRIQALVSTDVAARGIDIPGISTVIHADLPADVETYVHRSGRTGRAGETGRSLLLVPGAAERRIRRLLQSARIPLDWRPVPGPSKVRQSLQQRHHTRLGLSLDAAAGSSEEQRARATALLEDRDPIEVVARLLEMTEPALPCEPREIRSSSVPVGPSARSERGASGPRTRHDRGGFVRFRVNWGESADATPSRILSHVCRRGQIRSQHVGAIRVEHSMSHFEISREAADQFEVKARKRDARDPALMIRRADGVELPERPRSSLHTQRSKGALAAQLHPSASSHARE